MKNKLNPRIYLFGSFFLIVIGLLVYFVFFNTDSFISMVSGTEYISGEQGQIIVRLHDSNNNPLVNANCLVSLLYPDKTFFIVDQEMISTAVPGNYYISFTTPSAPGIYEEHIVCDVSGKTMFVSSSFHISTGLNLVSEVLNNQQIQFQRVINDILVTQDLMQNNVENLTWRLEGVENTLNQSIEENQQMLFDRFSQMGGAMANIFGNSS
jgi:hypothetical protein